MKRAICWGKSIVSKGDVSLCDNSSQNAFQSITNAVDQNVAYNRLSHVEGLEVVKCAKHQAPRQSVGTMGNLNILGTAGLRRCGRWCPGPGAGETSDPAWMNQVKHLTQHG